MLVNKIAELCAAKRIRIAQLEKTLGIGNGIIGKWRKSSPTVDKLKKVADFFGCTVDELLSPDTPTQ